MANCPRCPSCPCGRAMSKKRRGDTIGGPDSSYTGKGPPVFRQPFYFHAVAKVGWIFGFSQFAQGLCRFVRFWCCSHLCPDNDLAQGASANVPGDGRVGPVIAPV